jgi:hypothetical protein
MLQLGRLPIQTMLRCGTGNDCDQQNGGFSWWLQHLIYRKEYQVLQRSLELATPSLRT